MQKIYDNVSHKLEIGLREGLEDSISADFCVGYFNLNGFDLIGDLIFEHFFGDGDSCCRILVGRNENHHRSNSDTPEVLTEKFIEKLRTGFGFGYRDKLERLKHLIKLKKLYVKFSTSDLIHAKLYLFHDNFNETPHFAITGSSNLTYNGLVRSQELNVVIAEKETCLALQQWFDEHWAQDNCIDISHRIAWADYKEIVSEDLYSLASTFEKYEIECLIDSDGNRYEMPAAFLYDKKGIEEGMNPAFEEAIRQISAEKPLEELYFPLGDSFLDNFPYSGISVMDYIVESFFDPSDPNYVSPEILEEIERAADRDQS